MMAGSLDPAISLDFTLTVSKTIGLLLVVDFHLIEFVVGIGNHHETLHLVG